MKPVHPPPKKRLNADPEMVKEIQKWTSFASRCAQAAALTFAAGFRHSVRKGACCKMHAHAALEIVFHRTGSGITRVGNSKTVPFEEHAVVIYGPEALHDQVMATPGEDVCVQIKLPRSEYTRLGSIYFLPEVTDTILIEEMLSLAGSTVSENPAAQAILNHRATAVLLALLQSRSYGERTKVASPGAHHALKAEEYMKRHFQSISTLQEVADHLGVSLDHLRHVFRQEKKLSLVEFLTALRINRAKYLLCNSGLALKQIASLSGFSNEYYFSTVFRRQTAQSPASYRRKIPLSARP